MTPTETSIIGERIFCQYDNEPFTAWRIISRERLTPAGVVAIFRGERSFLRGLMNEVWIVPRPKSEPFPETEHTAETPVSMRHNRLPSDYLRRIASLEVLPGNASGSDKTWVHRAHAEAVRHLRSAKRR